MTYIGKLPHLVEEMANLMVLLHQSWTTETLPMQLVLPLPPLQKLVTINSYIYITMF